MTTPIHGRNEEAKGHNATGNRSLGGGAEKSQQYRKKLSSIFDKVHSLPEGLRLEHGAPNLFLAPGAI